MLKNKKIILGITGSIATYKVPTIIRDLQKNGAEVRVVATESALKFVSKLVVENLTHCAVVHDMFDSTLQCAGAWHVDWAHWCDAMLIAPCSATTLSKLSTGNADSPVGCVALALPASKSLLIAPAMDFTMFEHPATQHNIGIIQSRGGITIPPAEGELASGLRGKGRLPDNNVLLDKLYSTLSYTETLQIKDKKSILITAGATQEKLDDVRFISNYSTGKMGFALAQAAQDLGYNVTLISGNTSLVAPAAVAFIKVTSAEEMFQAVKENYKSQDIIVMAAAVSDYTPVNVFDGKLKKHNDEIVIKLKKTPDILKWLGDNLDHSKTSLVGFALESDNHLENATQKLHNKKCDMIVLNSARVICSTDNTIQQECGFGSDRNTITILNKNGDVMRYNSMSKYDCGLEILKALQV